MDWKFSEEQAAYAEALRDWLGSIAPSGTLREWLDAGNAADFEAAFAQDWAGVGFLEDCGGQGGGMVELAQTAEELGRAAVPSSAWLATALAAPLLATRPDLIKQSLEGAVVALLAPADWIPETAPTLDLAPDGTITGVVPRVLAGATAAHFIVVVDAGHGRQLRLVEARGAGVDVTRRKLLDRTREVAEISLLNAPSDPIAADVDAALRAATLRAAVVVAADTLGSSERMLELAVEYSKQRRQFGVPIASFQAVKHAAATIMVGVEAARSVVYYAAASVEAGTPQAELHAAAAKAQVTAEGPRAADSALTIHGAIGYTWEHDLQLFYKRAKLNETLMGAPAAWNERIADGLALA